MEVDGEWTRQDWREYMIEMLLPLQVATVLPRFNPPPNTVLTTTEMLHLLDSFTRPGLTLEQFNELIAVCECGMVVTQRMFRWHDCIKGWAVARKEPEVIDLT